MIVQADELRERFTACDVCVPDEHLMFLWELAGGDEETMQTLVDDAHEMGVPGL